MAKQRLVWFTNADKRDRRYPPAGCIVGKPKATEEYTVAELEGFNIVGIYKVEEAEEEPEDD